MISIKAERIIIRIVCLLIGGLLTSLGDFPIVVDAVLILSSFLAMEYIYHYYLVLVGKYIRWRLNQYSEHNTLEKGIAFVDRYSAKYYTTVWLKYEKLWIYLMLGDFSAYREYRVELEKLDTSASTPMDKKRLWQADYMVAFLTSAPLPEIYQIKTNHLDMIDMLIYLLANHEIRASEILIKSEILYSSKNVFMKVMGAYLLCREHTKAGNLEAALKYSQQVLQQSSITEELKECIKNLLNEMILE